MHAAVSSAKRCPGPSTRARRSPQVRPAAHLPLRSVPPPIRGPGSPQECSSVGRASVSKTEGRGFESLHSCHFRGNLRFVGLFVAYLNLGVAEDHREGRPLWQPRCRHFPRKPRNTWNRVRAPVPAHPLDRHEAELGSLVVRPGAPRLWAESSGKSAAHHVMRTLLTLLPQVDSKMERVRGIEPL